MMRAKTSSNMFSLLYKPLLIMSLLFSLFVLVWLRSNVVQTAYEIRNLEEKKMEVLKNTKMLLAERAKIMSLEKIYDSFQTRVQRDNAYARNGYVFPDRVNVVHMKRNKTSEPFRASLELRRRD